MFHFIFLFHRDVFEGKKCRIKKTGGSTNVGFNASICWYNFFKLKVCGGKENGICKMSSNENTAVFANRYNSIIEARLLILRYKTFLLGFKFQSLGKNLFTETQIWVLGIKFAHWDSNFNIYG